MLWYISYKWTWIVLMAFRRKLLCVPLFCSCLLLPIQWWVHVLRVHTYRIHSTQAKFIVHHTQFQSNCYTRIAQMVCTTYTPQFNHFDNWEESNFIHDKIVITTTTTSPTSTGNRESAAVVAVIPVGLCCGAFVFFSSFIKHSHTHTNISLIDCIYINELNN